MKRYGLSLVFVLISSITLFSGCGIYSFTGASIDGKTIYIHNLQNRALNVVPSLVPTMGNIFRDKILSQTGLAAVNNSSADYELKTVITGYNVTISGMASSTQASQNRLTITIEVDFEDKKNDKNSFSQSFSRFDDFPASTQLQAVENALIDKIAKELAEDVFNKAFINW